MTVFFPPFYSEIQDGRQKRWEMNFYVVTLRRGRPRTREQLLLQNYKA